VNSGFFRPPEAHRAGDVCVTVGSHLRDFETLREAIKLIWAANPNMRFVAVGTRSDKKSCFPELPDDRIQFRDRISDEELLGVYQSATIAVLSFREATANNAMLEAMACGLPLVATDVGGIRDYVVPGTGILCPLRDPRSLANAALEILSDAGKRERMSRASRDAAVALDFSRVANQMADVYRRVLAMD
jgi:glycosyltransferase involved in cell wall biosynthesis